MTEITPDMAVRASKPGRAQAGRAADTRQVLIDATVRLLDRLGYSGTTTERIAAEAGVSRGALQYHFPTRFQLMREVLEHVYAREREAYLSLIRATGKGRRASDWPELMWEVLHRPDGVAVLEILQASRSDPELAKAVIPVQQSLDQAGIEVVDHFNQGDKSELLSRLRFFHWAIRGLSIARILTNTPEDIKQSVAFLSALVDSAVATGLMRDPLIGADHRRD